MGDDKAMRIKRLEILGFKSFMEKTVFDFEPGITAIVGPNGCGKSNIVDAIKWVLGEQSPKQLRGRSMDDVIFNGSSSFKPLGMAEVIITFENTDGTILEGFPQYSEIEVCRRMFRSGETEYYLNKVPCRRKDIWELFLNTGIGMRAYSIVEQERIGFIINAKPEERRFIIEEAGGISKYRSRKEETLRKMEATRQNLIRINDVQKEMERQMKLLEHQSHQAEKYRDLRESYRQMEISLKAHQLRNLEEEHMKILKNLKDLNEKKDFIKIDIDEKLMRMEKLRLEIAEKDIEFSRLQEGLYRLEGEIQKKEGEKNYIEMELGRLKNIFQRGDFEIKEIQRRILKTRKEIENLTLERESIKIKLNREKEELLSKENEFNKRQALFTSSEKWLDEEKARLIDDLTKRATLKNTLLNLRRQLESIQASSKKIERERNEIVSKIAFLERERVRILASLEKLENEREELSRRNSLNRESYNRASTSLEERKGELEIKRKELTHKESRLSSLEELQRNFEGYPSGVKEIMLAKENGEFSEDGAFKLLTEVMEIPPKYEGLIENILCERLQSVIVENEKDGIKAIEYLKNRSTGRNSFIVRDLINHHYKEEDLSPIDNKSEAILLSDLVKMEPGFEKIGKVLFGDVIVVEDLDRAMKLWDENGGEKTVITLDGDIIQPPGILTGGTGNGSIHGLLGRIREIKELESSVNDLQAEIGKNEEEIEKISKEVMTYKKEWEELERLIKEREFEIESLKMEKIRRDEDIQISLRRKDVINLEMEQLKEEFDSLKKEEISTNEKIVELEKMIEERNKAIEGKKERHERIQGELKGMTDELTRMRISIASMSEKAVNIEDNIQRLKKMEIEMDSRLSSLIEEIDRSLSEKERLEGLLEDLKRDIIELHKRHKGMNDEIGKLKEQHSLLSEEIHKLELNSKGLKGEKQIVEESINGLRLEEQELRIKKEHLKNELMERFGLRSEDLNSLKEKEGEDEESLRLRLSQLREEIEGFGEVNLMAIKDYEDLKKRYDFISAQKEDLVNAIKKLQKAIIRINRNSRRRFIETFNAINESFRVVFPRLFNGGEAYLVLQDPEEVLESGVDIVVQPPGKKLQNINLLSGGEKALTAVALLFSILFIKPTPFCIFDEVDAPLDDANIDRFINMVKEISKTTQFILVTHNKRTMEIADILYGITMEEPGVSKLISVKMN
jgi:chromosome segregation protein